MSLKVIEHEMGERGVRVAMLPNRYPNDAKGMNEKENDPVLRVGRDR